MIIFRIFYRSGKTVLAHGDDQLKALLARKWPASVHHEIALIHECGHCGKRSPWDDDWFALADRHAWQPDQSWIIFCGRQCWIDATGGHHYDEWQLFKSSDHRPEPARSRELESARWSANWSDRMAISDSKKYRSVPLPADWPGAGICRWCGKEIIETKGRNRGKRSKRHNWHPACKDEYFLHSDLGTQYHYLAKRDGAHCHWLGCDEKHDLEVDHKIPLFSVRDLPDDERRKYYGPGNLWLLCKAHHKAKSAREAAQRAEAARLARSQIQLPL